MSGIMLNLAGGSFAPSVPTVIGQAYGGGFYAGKIAVGGGGVATHYLIVAPKASGESTGSSWGTYGVTTIATSVIDGPTNTTILAALGAAYQAAVFCNNLNAGGGLNGYTDWYLPAQNELEVLYYFLKPSTDVNDTSYGSNANAVSPEPISTNYSSGSPAQTSATGVNGFRTGEANVFMYGVSPFYYWSSTQSATYPAGAANIKTFEQGIQGFNNKANSNYVRAVRRIPV